MKMHGRFGVMLAIVLGLSGCDTLDWKEREVGEIPFTLTGIESGACPSMVKVGPTKWQLDYFGFYLTKPEVRIDGKWQRVSFKQTKWQTQSTALLKFHSLCSSPDDANNKIILDVSEGLLKLATNLRFTMGLPFDANHANPLSQASPLNDTSMFLNRQQGHRFLRLDLSQAGANEKQWSYHLGSANCTSASTDTPPEASCAFTNRVEFILPMTQLDSELTLELSVSNILAQVDILEAPSCEFSSPEAPPCKQLLRNLLNRPWIKWE
ncbi:metallo-mystery pair system four-Cys motif protein [Alteromonas sp. 1_MG-2023]|uniref:MbnP family protein n=1 Tax=Alteromonas sp. 1_MG-2023 TaxID=3062669 RepID=UPI0026E1616B|nr:MbnP family protein [Alteromonas sp. 1_MG-2023]MDO6565532.1 metallo-mystery pair system four-Cys motif protein [Alteromonas sp. 1_MG-2023]